MLADRLTAAGFRSRALTSGLKMPREIQLLALFWPENQGIAFWVWPRFRPKIRSSQNFGARKDENWAQKENTDLTTR